MWTILLCEKTNDPYTCGHDYGEDCVEKHVDVISTTEVELVLKEMRSQHQENDAYGVGYEAALYELQLRLERIE